MCSQLEAAYKNEIGVHLNAWSVYVNFSNGGLISEHTLFPIAAPLLYAKYQKFPFSLRLWIDEMN